MGRWMKTASVKSLWAYPPWGWGRKSALKAAEDVNTTLQTGSLEPLVDV